MTKRICVLAGFDAPAAEHILALRARLRESGLAGRENRRLPPHITLDLWPMEQAGAIAERLCAVAEASPPFPLRFTHLGVFPGGKVLFAAPEASRPLLALKERFAPASGWAPHATVFIQDPAAVLQAVSLLSGGFLAFAARVERLYLYEVGTGRLLLERPLRPGR